MSVIDQPWTKTREFFAAPKCTVAQPKALGGWQQSEVDDQVKNIASWSASQLSGFMNEYFQDFQIKNVQKQVVSGINYKFTLELLINGQVCFEFEFLELVLY
jgi:hypothetical protein